MRDRRYWGRSAAFGAVGGWTMMILLMTLSYWADAGFWFPLKAVAGVQYGVRALIGADEVILTGVLNHTLASLFFGLGFAVLIRRVQVLSESLLSGLLYGIGVWALMSYLILPFVNAPMLARLEFAEGWWFSAHLIFGSIVGLNRPAKRRAIRAVEREELRRAV